MQAWANGPACWHCQPGRDCQATQCRQAVAAGDPVSNRGRRQQAADDPLLCHRHNTRYATPHDQLAAMLALVCTLLYSYRGSTAGCAIIIQWPRIYSCNGRTKDTRNRHSDLESNLERHYLIRAYCGRQSKDFAENAEDLPRETDSKTQCICCCTDRCSQKQPHAKYCMLQLCRTMSSTHTNCVVKQLQLRQLLQHSLLPANTATTAFTCKTTTTPS
ncbi:hypothetical protein COO60DRAFT_967027 [Scenedesmus sp. NREL 46B-D3]|nr:hypothetical protein COO60DRAFT_967027 [Scenedesmus sp. NREL 46B-D3]